MFPRTVFVFFTRLQNSSAETFEHVSALTRQDLNPKAETNTSAAATSNRRTTSSHRRTNQEFDKEESENCGEPLLWFGALSLSYIRPCDWARIFRREAPTARTPNSDPIAPRRSSRCFGREKLQRYSDPGTEKKPIMPRLRGMIRRGVGGLLLLIPCLARPATVVRRLLSSEKMTSKDV